MSLSGLRKEEDGVGSQCLRLQKKTTRMDMKSPLAPFLSMITIPTLNWA